MFQKAHEENCKQEELEKNKTEKEEFEKNKTEKEAEMEKAKCINWTNKRAKDSC